MKQDNQVKHILMNSAERTSADFTNTVMQKITDAQAPLSAYQPLVPPRIRRLFVFTFGSVTAAIVALCLMIVITDTHVVSRMLSLRLPDLDYRSILVYILIFWAIFFVNAHFQGPPRRIQNASR